MTVNNNKATFEHATIQRDNNSNNKTLITYQIIKIVSIH